MDLKKLVGALKNRHKYRPYNFRNHLKNYHNLFFDLERLLEGKDVQIIVDGGAFIGDISKKLNYIFPNARIYSFEPCAASFEGLQNNVKNIKEIMPINKALSSSSGKKALFKTSQPYSNSLQPVLGTASDLYPDAMTPIGTEEIDAITLDEWAKEEALPRVDLLKLDLQGHELEALKGAVSLLKTGIPAMLIEVEFIELYQANCLYFELAGFLHKFGYKTYNFYQQAYTSAGQIIYCDAIFIKGDLI